jgi:hypothetical protein
MRRLSSVNIRVNCVFNSVRCNLPTMRTTTKKTNYAVQRQTSDFDDWDTIRTSITPHEARARRLMRWQQDLRTHFHFRVVKLETETTITPVEDK